MNGTDTGFSCYLNHTNRQHVYMRDDSDYKSKFLFTSMKKSSIIMQGKLKNLKYSLPLLIMYHQISTTIITPIQPFLPSYLNYL